METSLSVGNDAVLRSARRWIIGAYVWNVLGFQLYASYVSSTVDHSLPPTLETLHPHDYVFTPGVFLLFILIAFFKLKSHSNARIQQAATVFMIAFTFNVIVRGIIGTFLPDSMDFSFQIVIVKFLLVALAFYPLIKAYTYLGDVYSTERGRTMLSNLYLVTFVNSVAVMFEDQMFQLPLAILFSIFWWKLLCLPMDTAAVEEKDLSITFLPTRIEVGFIVSLLLFTLLLTAISVLK